MLGNAKWRKESSKDLNVIKCCPKYIILKGEPKKKFLFEIL